MTNYPKINFIKSKTCLQHKKHNSDNNNNSKN